MKENVKHRIIVAGLSIAIVIAMLFPYFHVSGTDIDGCIGEETLEIINQVSDEYGVCPELIEAMVYYESSGNPDVVSKAGCIGLMQINPKHHAERMEELGVTDLTDPYSNILVGTDYLMELADKYQDLPVVLMAYNEGEYSGAINRASDGNVSKYAEKIIRLSSQLEKAHGK